MLNCTEERERLPLITSWRCTTHNSNVYNAGRARFCPRRHLTPHEMVLCWHASHAQFMHNKADLIVLYLSFQ